MTKTMTEHEICSRARFVAILAVLGASACHMEEDAPLPAEEFREAPSSIEIVADGSEVTISWPTQPGSTYSVYRSTDPSFVITDPDVVQIAAGIPGWQYMDVYELDHDDPRVSSDDHDVGVFYQVVEHTAAGADHLLPKVGRVSAGLVPSRTIPLLGAQYEYAKVPLCLYPTPSDATVLQLEQSESIGGVHWWDAEAQHWVSPAGFDAVLDRRLGNVLSVRGAIDNAAPELPANGSDAHGFYDYFELTGVVMPAVPPVCGPWETSLYEGLNAVAWPVISAPTTAQAVRDAMPGDVSVGHWDVVEQQLRWYPDVPADPPPGVVSVATNDFSIEPCSAVYIDIETNGNMPDGTSISFIEGVWWPLYCAP